MAASTIAKEEIAEIWAEYKEDQSNEYLRNRLVENYLPLVKYNGERIWARLPDGVELDDLISAGVFGLMDAIDAFDLSRGVKFETYCVPRIRGAMLDELRTMDWVPRLVRSKASRTHCLPVGAPSEPWALVCEVATDLVVALEGSYTVHAHLVFQLK